MTELMTRANRVALEGGSLSSFDTLALLNMLADRDRQIVDLGCLATERLEHIVAAEAKLADADMAQAALVERAAAKVREEAKVSPYHNGMTVVYQRGLSDGFEAAAQVVDALAPDAGVKDLAALRAERDGWLARCTVAEGSAAGQALLVQAARADRDRLAAELAEARKERDELAFMGRTLQGWTQHDVLVNHEGAYQAIKIMGDRLAALTAAEEPKP